MCIQKGRVAICKDSLSLLDPKVDPASVGPAESEQARLRIEAVVGAFVCLRMFALHSFDRCDRVGWF